MTCNCVTMVISINFCYTETQTKYLLMKMEMIILFASTQPEIIYLMCINLDLNLVTNCLYLFVYFVNEPLVMRRGFRGLHPGKTRTSLLYEI